MDQRPAGPEAAPDGDASPTMTDPPAPAPAASGWVVPAPDPHPRRTRTLVALAVSILVIAFLGITIFIGSQVDPYEVANREFGERLLAAPGWDSRYGDVTTSEDAFRVGLELSQTAFARLDDADLLRYWQLSHELLGLADPAACTRVFRQTMTPTDGQEITRLLDLDAYREYLALTLAAFEAELSGTVGPPVPSDLEAEGALIALAAAMGDEAVTAAATTMGDATATDAAVCTAGRDFLAGALGLAEPDRATLLRWMAVP
jgi:hypothetical protein